MHQVPVGRRSVDRHVLTHRRHDNAVGKFKLVQGDWCKQLGGHIIVLALLLVVRPDSSKTERRC